MKKAFISLLILTILGFLLLIDDDLLPEAEAWLAEVNTNERSQAYLFLLGMMAAEDDDPIAIGQHIFDSIKLSETQFLAGEEIADIYQYPEDKRLPLSKSDLYCSLNEFGCYQIIRENKKRLQEEVDMHHVLLKRYRQFLALNDFFVMAKPLLHTPIPPYQYLSHANRLFLLQLYLSAQGNESQKSLADISDLIEVLKQHLVMSNTLISKMVFQKMLADAVDTVWAIKNELELYDAIMIEPLSDTERDMHMVLRNEFELSYLLYQNLDKHPEFIEEGGDLPPWSVRLLFKPNMTSNESFEYYLSDLKLSQLNSIEFSQAIGDQTEDKHSFLSVMSVRNPIGKILLNIAKLSFGQYILRMHNLNAKIDLVNQITVSNDGVLQHEQIPNPYYADTFAVLSKDQQRICFKTPMEDAQNDACLVVH